MNIPLLVVNNLYFSVAQKILGRALSFAVKPGEIWGLTGPNGSGKTTLLHTLGGLHPPDQGDIYLNGKNIRHLSPREMAKTRGILFQHTTATFPQSVYDYCLAGRFIHQSFLWHKQTEHTQAVKRALSATHLSEQAARSITTLSGGEQRRLAFSTLLAQSPSLYLLDEPFNHLDTSHRAHLKTLLIQLATRKAGIIIALHEPELIQSLCSRTLSFSENGHVNIRINAD